ncbi:hypothetical protein VB712_14475 [Spirulina sp. CCNP1310]|uniref:hypothetical protein n=1 Tax=Spirulina sp. CCNP1310 TaxID=3110249 RepID=UPI002B20E781|nr:hypothetical protein [Spirulina sp. CCNP1310]MEA5420434.1 hypothetical protein [Spirulina sp. CCNP1310]
MFTAVQRIVEKYQALGIMKAGEILLEPSVALSLMQELQQENNRIYGVDFWYYRDGQLVEDFNSLDLSDVKDPQAAARITQVFLSEYLPKNIVLVSLVFDDD